MSFLYSVENSQFQQILNINVNFAGGHGIGIDFGKYEDDIG